MTVALHHGAPPTSGSFVAVAVRYNRADDQWHVGVMYRGDSASTPRILHLAWDRLLLDQPIDHPRLAWERGYAWVELPISLEQCRVLTQVCRRAARRIAEEGQRVRYSVRYALGRFNPETGEYLPQSPERGLTCATCVLALCVGAGVPLLDVHDWPPREDDRAWIEKIIRDLREDDPVHADEVAADGLCARFRPTEVASACLASKLPVDFAQALALAVQLRAQYDALPFVMDA